MWPTPEERIRRRQQHQPIARACIVLFSFCSSVRHGGPGPLETDPVRAAARRNGVEVCSGSARRRLPSPPACSARKRVEVGFGSALAVGMPRENFKKKEALGPSW